MLKRFGTFAVTGVLAMMVLAACGSDDDDAEPTVTRAPATNAPQVTATAAEAEEEETAAASPAAGSPVAGSPVASPVASESASPVAEETATTAVTTTAVTTTAASPVASPEASPAVGTPQVPPPPTGFEVDMKDIAFDPKEIRIPANTDVVIQLPNTGVTTHNFNIDALGIKSGDVAAGGETSVTINAAPGTYDYYCSIPGHKEAGMVGKLIVE